MTRCCLSATTAQRRFRFHALSYLSSSEFAALHNKTRRFDLSAKDRRASLKDN
jgi:hypothetical protein